MPTWEIIEEHRNRRTHAITMSFRETDENGSYVHRITLPEDATKNEFLKELKRRVREERKTRNKARGIRNSIDPAEIEPFIGGEE